MTFRTAFYVALIQQGAESIL